MRRVEGIDPGGRCGRSVGRYDTLSFTFRDFLTLPEIEVNSEDLWVDERRRTLYVVVAGQLLRIVLHE